MKCVICKKPRKTFQGYFEPSGRFNAKTCVQCYKKLLLGRLPAREKTKGPKWTGAFTEILTK
jgi:hypothetical protein